MPERTRLTPQGQPSCGGTGCHPAVEALRGGTDAGFLAVARQHPSLGRQVEQPLADRGELPRKVGKLSIMRRRAAGEQRVPGEDGLSPAQYRLTEPGV